MNLKNVEAKKVSTYGNGITNWQIVRIDSSRVVVDNISMGRDTTAEDVIKTFQRFLTGSACNHDIVVSSYYKNALVGCR